MVEFLNAKPKKEKSFMPGNIAKRTADRIDFIPG
jgi:hypothetical protein